MIAPFGLSRFGLWTITSPPRHPNDDGDHDHLFLNKGRQTSASVLCSRKKATRVMGPDCYVGEQGQTWHDVITLPQTMSRARARTVHSSEPEPGGRKPSSPDSW
jgi:hypothetical protein